VSVEIPAGMVAWLGIVDSVKSPDDWDSSQPVMYGDGTVERLETTWGTARWLPGGGPGRIVAYFPRLIGRWYAIGHCWDPAEGIIPGVANAALPLPSSASYRSPMTFATADEASDWAYAHDIEDAPTNVDAWVLL